MGNSLSKKIDNNGKIWRETIRNFNIGCMFGLFLTILKYRRQIFRILRQRRKSRNIPTSDNPPSSVQSPSSMSTSSISPKSYLKSNNFSSKSSAYRLSRSKSVLSERELLMEMFVYGIKFPLFLAGFSIIFKKLIRMNYISSALDVNTLTLPEQKHSIALMSFLLAYSMQKNVGIFHWKWSLLLLIRALYGWTRLVISKECQIFTVQDLHSVLAPLIGCFFVSKYSKSLPQSIISTYRACYSYPHRKWIDNYTPNSRSLPQCTSTASFHECQGDCLTAFWKDALTVIGPISFKFFIKLHSVAAMLGGMKFIKDVRTKPQIVAFRVGRNALRSTLYWAIGVHAAVRCCSCFNRKFVHKLYEFMDNVMATKVNREYAYYPDKNIGSLFLLTAICGRYNVLAEPAGRQSEIVISLIWYEMMHILRHRCGLKETNDDDSYHWLLGANSFASILLATTVFVNMYVYCRDATYLKSMERRLIAKYLIE